jgi:hypothetical protein
MAHFSTDAGRWNWSVREKALLEQWKYLKELRLNASERADSERRGT